MLHLFVWAFLIFQNVPDQEVFEKIRFAMTQNDLKTAETLALEAVRKFPENDQVHYFLGGIRSRQARFQEAEEEFLQVVRINPQFPDVYVLLGTLYQNQNRVPEAVAILKKGLNHLPDNSAIRYQLGVVFTAAADFKNALEVLEPIPENEVPAGFWDTIGKAYALSGDVVKAANAYQKYLEVNPNSVRTLHTLSAIALNNNNSSKAWEYIAQARRLAPNSPQVLLDFAYISMAENLVGEAAAALQFLLLMQPNNSDAVFELGSAFIHFANFDSSRDLFRHYVELKPNDPLGHAMLGYVLYLSNIFDEARTALTKALEINPELIDATFYLAMIEFSQARDEEAERLFKQVIDKAGDHGRAYLNLGKLHIRKRQLEEAEAVLEKAVELMPTDFEVHFQLSRVYAGKGDRERAAHSLRLFNKYQKEKEAREQESRRTPYTQFYTGPPSSPAP